jgi:voltage-gated potassium channel
VRYNKAMRHFTRAMLMAREQIILFMAVTLVLIYFAAVGIYYFENEAQPDHFASIFDSLWWSIVTLTTVGYGDVYPITLGGRIFTFFILLIGLGIVAVPTGIISSSLTKAVELESEQE